MSDDKPIAWNDDEVTILIESDTIFSTNIIVEVIDQQQAFSDPYDISVEVSPVNDIPVITGHSSILAFEDQPFTLLIDSFEISELKLPMEFFICSKHLSKKSRSLLCDSITNFLKAS